MLPLAPVTSLASPLALAIALATAPAPTTPDLPVLEVIKVYGKLAGPLCYGTKAPPGSSCQIQRQDLERALGLANNQALSRTDFEASLNRMDFQWPLKPYGVDKSLSKTSVMNKGAETRVFMDELENRGLYDRRNPTGPLPTSLRPVLNQKLQMEGLDPRALDLVFSALASERGELSSQQIQTAFQGKEEIDYYDFLKIIGTDSVLWPN